VEVPGRFAPSPGSPDVLGSQEVAAIGDADRCAVCQETSRRRRRANMSVPAILFLVACCLSVLCYVAWRHNFPK